MDDDVLVIAVRLCDTDEREQPDPLCLRLEELATWRHFESLLCDMFKSPPHAIKVSYLDDESDWVELSSDAELKEAIKLTKSSGEILQLCVKRVDDEKLIKLENAAPSFQDTTVLKPCGGNAIYYVPTTDPGGDVFGRLIYPYPSAGKLESDHALPACLPTVPYMTEPQVLVYPHPKDSASVAYVKSSGLPLQLFQNPDGDALKDLPSVDVRRPTTRSEERESTFAIPWDQAEALTTEKKMYYLKAMMTSGGSPSSEHEIKLPDSEKGSNEGVLLADLPSPHAVIVEPLCAQPGSLGQNFIPNQDPFELEGDSASEEGIQGFLPRMCSPTLVPTSALMDPGNRQDKTLAKETEGGTSSIPTPVKLIDWVSAVHSAMSFNPASPSPPATGAPPYSSAIPKCKLGKKSGEKSCTMKLLPGNLLMMVGAQSGANAVAIEMPPEPEFFHHSVNKDEEIAASGGASSTSASEETGEVLTRAGSDAAAVSREMKTFPQPAVSFDISPAANEDLTHKLEKKSSKRSEMKTKISSGKKEKLHGEKKEKLHSEKREKLHSEKKEKLADRKDPLGSGVKVKCEKVKNVETKKKTSESCHRESRKKSDDKKVVTEDVESGEKVRVKAEPVLKVKTFMKLLEQMKQDMHQNIVRDVAKQTDSLLQALINSQKIQAVMEPKFNKGQVIHVDIYCDNCNDEICGIRYKCGNCLDFDLCEVCEDLPNIHDPTHVFLKLRYPARNAGQVGIEKAPLLRENIYLTDRPVDQHTESSCDTEKKLTVTEIVDSKEKMLIDEPEKNCDQKDLLKESDVQNILTIDSDKDIDTDSGDSVRDDKNEVVLLTKLIPATPTTHNLPVLDEPLSPTASESSSSSIISLTYPGHSIPIVALTKAMNKDKEEEQLMSDDTAVVSLEDLEISPARRLESPNQPIFFDMEDDSSFQEWDSDSSDDFCIIEPSHSSICREDYEALPGEDHELLQSTQSMDQGRANEEPLVNSTGFTYQTTTLMSTTATDAHREELEELLAEPLLSGQDHDTEAAESVHSIQEDNLVHKMNEEERTRYKLLLQAEILEEHLKKKELEKAQKEEEMERAQREQEVERVKREEELERVQKEQEVKTILEAKEREAAFINENLERAAKQKELVEQKTTASLSRSQSMEEAVSKRDVDCQANLEVVHPASHIIQNVASGVSKAATTAYYTAKDVFYSLQAKQNEWKAPSSTYKPPQSGWTPPGDNYIPPSSKWTPPPQSQFVLPPSCLESSDMADTQTEGAKVDATTGKRLSSGGSRPVNLMEGSDSELTRELKAMQHLIEMGFANREQNRQLLNKFDGDLEKVVQCLLQEEGETGEHWAIHRH